MRGRGNLLHVSCFQTKLLTENILPGNDYSSIKERRDKTHRQKTISVSL
jgi:hypothetical protein